MQHSPFSLRSDDRLLWIGGLLVVTCLVALYFFNRQVDLDHAIDHIQENIARGEVQMEETLDHLSTLEVGEMSRYVDEHREKFHRCGLSFYVRDEEQLLTWSSSSVPEIDLLGDYVESGPCILLRNGYYLISERIVGDITIHGLFLIKYEYNYENRYLINDYPDYFDLDARPTISFVADDQSRDVVDENGEHLFYLNPSQRMGSVGSVSLWMVLLLIGLYLLIQGGFARAFRSDDRLVTLFLLSVTVLLIRWVALVMIDGSFLLNISGFSPAIYASSILFPSLFDLLINAFLFLLICYFGFKWVQGSKIGKAPLWGIVFFLLVYFSYGFWINELIISVVNDSSLTLDISAFFEVDGYGIVAVISICMLLISIFYFSRILHLLIRASTMRWKGLAAMMIAAGIVLIVVADLLLVVDMVLVLWTWILLLLLILMDIGQEGRMLFSRMLLGLIVLSLYSSYMMEKYVSLKDRKNLEVIADRLLDGTDPVAEYLFEEFKEDLGRDSLVWDKERIEDYDINLLKEELQNRYFKGYWSRYDLRIDLLRTDSTGATVAFVGDGQSIPELESSLVASWPLGRSPDLVKTTRSEYNVNYVARVDLGQEIGRVSIGFVLKIIPDELGFPELLLEGESLLEEQLTRYSIAQYYRDRLIAQHGEYDYKTLLDLPPEEDLVDGEYFDRNGYVHHTFSRGDETYLISGEEKSTLHLITTFTYLFSLLGAMMLIGALAERAISGRMPLVVNLQNKIQMLIIGVVLISLLVFGIGAYIYIIQQNREKNENLLSEKVESVLIELEHKLEKERATNDRQKLEIYLDKFSKVFFTDINLFALNGELLASSRPQLFNKGIISTRMDPEAYRELAEEKESKYIKQEQIGELEYLSAYVPFRNSESEILAYLNLPYFAKQTELEDELSAFVVAMVNVLVLLFAFSILVAVVFSNWITRPLKILQESLATISLDRTNRPIDYSGTDEIASLVKQYNAKVKELEENAEALAKSERESAWREMAKQVAHEIKNPLTPMKLSIQYLQRSFEDGSDNWEDRFKRSTNTLIEQIDTLSGIATAFGDFAKMPTPVKESFDLLEVLEQTVGLFSGQPDMEVVFVTEVTTPLIIEADRDQVTRLFNNLIKNAMQSIPEQQVGKVTVQLEVKGFQYLVEVKDNGDGIPKAMYDRIFVPNFTTKTTGTGLGLAMCKNIVESAGGEIWFRSKEGVGTSFFVSLPEPEGE